MEKRSSKNQHRTALPGRGQESERSEQRSWGQQRLGTPHGLKTHPCRRTIGAWTIAGHFPGLQHPRLSSLAPHPPPLIPHPVPAAAKLNTEAEGHIKGRCALCQERPCQVQSKVEEEQQGQADLTVRCPHTT